MNMMKCSQIKHYDTLAIVKYGIPGMLLMEHAALAVMKEIEQRHWLSGKIVIICGKGNNGGDGYALAHLLYRKGADVSLLNLFCEKPKTADASVFYNITRQLAIPDAEISDIDRADVIVDAVFGIGMKQELNTFCCDVIQRINQTSAKKVCIDLPSGMDGDQAFQTNPMVAADLTVTFTAYKPGLLFYPSAYAAGEVVLADIGIPPMNGGELTNVIDESMIRRLFPKREPSGHKNTFGAVLTTGGSTGMTGAISLCSQAALFSGCGLVTAAVPQSLNPIMEQKLTEVMTVPLSDCDTGCFSASSADLFLQYVRKNHVTVFGPGAGTGEGVAVLLKALLSEPTSVVIDADGLNVLSKQTDWLLAKQCQTCILTPHPKEASRLSGISVAEIEADRIGFARSFAKKYHVILVLKGARTVIASPNGNVYVNRFGNSGMATAGSGDVLAGMIGGLLAQGADGESAAVCAVAIHALSGDLLRKKIGTYGMTAGELCRQIPYTIKEVLGVESC